MLSRFRTLLLAGAMLPALAAGAAKPKYYVKELTFPEGATTEQKVEMAARLVPTAQQLEWQNLGLTAFLHFGMNTFTDREWGDGKESPEWFNPTNLDTDQWVKTLKDAGFKLVILTAKHHDGFCLWPTKTTPHSVANSPWKGGKGDVVKDLRASCDKYGMKLGLYLSPWDRNAPVYGDSEKYNDMFVAQLSELLGNYGKIDEVWFDGACGEGPNGKKQVYDWPRFRATMEKYQPNAVLAITGDDVRWVGNEHGEGRETEWSATVLTPSIHPGSEAADKAIGVNAMDKDLGSRAMVAKAPKMYWWPSEVDVSVRPGWFYHEKEQPKSLRQLAEIYLTSVGRNSVLLLNIPPDTEGRIHSTDVERLKEFNKWVTENFSNNLARSFSAKTGEIKLKTPGTTVNAVMLREDISKGQRVENFAVEAFTGGKWVQVAEGTTIGFKRILTFPEVKADRLRVKITGCRTNPILLAPEVFLINMPAQTATPSLPGYRTPRTTQWSSIEATGNLIDAPMAYDGNTETFWQSGASKGEKALAIDLQKEMPVAGFIYTPRAGADKSGTIFHYRFYTSTNGTDWTEAKTNGEFSNIVNNPIEQCVYLPVPVNARYVKLVGVDEIAGRDYITVGEFRVMVPAPKGK